MTLAEARAIRRRDQLEALNAAATRKHRPASHPVLRSLPAQPPKELVNLSPQIEAIARLLATMPDQPLTQRNRTELAIIARELMRRVES